MKRINLNQFSVDDLLSLRERLNAMLASRVDREKKQLEARLKRLQRFKAAGAENGKAVTGAKAATAGKTKRKRKSSGKVAPKYRNPENSSETWAGRGLQPRWLKAALSNGKKLADFQI